MNIANVNGLENFNDIEIKKIKLMIDQHMRSFEKWNYGSVYKLFKEDGIMCVEYESGDWWHYPSPGTWY